MVHTNSTRLREQVGTPRCVYASGWSDEVPTSLMIWWRQWVQDLLRDLNWETKILFTRSIRLACKYAYLGFRETKIAVACCGTQIWCPLPHRKLRFSLLHILHNSSYNIWTLLDVVHVQFPPHMVYVWTFAVFKFLCLWHCCHACVRVLYCTGNVSILILLSRCVFFTTTLYQLEIIGLFAVEEDVAG